jgi:hypothetical protein
MRRFALLFVAMLGCAGQLTGGVHGGDADGAPGDPADASIGPPPPDAAPGTPDAAPPPPGACKRGVAYNREDGADAPVLGQGVGWWYNWSESPGAAGDTLQNAGLEFVPMVFSGPPTRTIDVDAIVARIPAGSKYLLGFNEPNFGNQANLTPQQAAAAWPQVEAIADRLGLKIVSPAVNYCGGNCNETDPFVWLDAFFAACHGCRVDYVAFHWYACSKDALSSFLGQYENRYGKPIWLTEFACLDDPGDHSLAGQRAYMHDAVPLLESDPKVFRYAWFIGRSFPNGEADNLLGNPGALTPLGADYVGYPGACAP